MGRNTCPTCGLMVVAPIGPVNAEILIVTDAPDFDDVRNGRLMSGKSGEVLRKELAQAGIQLGACRVVSLWPHGKSKECELEPHISQLASEIATPHKWVLLTSSESSKILTGHAIMEITGLQVKSKMFPKVKFFGMPHPGTLLHGDVGEMRLAMEKFTQIRNKKK